MKISEYNDMMKYLTRSPQIKLPKEKKDEFGYTPSQNRELEKYIATRPSFKESNGAWKRFVEPEKLAEKRKKESASKEQLEGLEKRLANARAHVTPSEKKKMSKQDEYDTYFNKNSPKYYNKKSKPIDPVKINIDNIPELERPDPVFDEQERQFKQILAEQKQKESDKWTTGLASFHRKKY